MIITEGEQTSPPKSQTPLLPTTAPAQAPPPYGSTSSHPLPGEPPKPEPHLRAGRRFLKALAVALLIWLLLWALCQSILDLFQHGVRHSWPRMYQGIPTGPKPSDGTPLNCTTEASWTSTDTPDSSFSAAIPFPPYSSKTQFKLPLSSQHLFLLARGSLSSGSVAIEALDQPGDDAIVDIEVRYWHREARDQAKLCLLERPEGGKGVGIYTPYAQWPIDQNQLRFTIVVRLPAPISSPLKLNAFSTQLPLFRHDIGALLGRVSFDSLDLTSSNSPIRAESVQVSYAHLKTTNSPITGTFNVSDSLVIDTSNGHIDGSFGLVNDNKNKFTSLVLKTSNARVTGAIWLVSTANNTGGWFTVSPTTSNGRIDLSFPTSPPLSHLTLAGRTSNAGVSVALDRNYEGTFILDTSNARSDVEEHKVEDPTGAGRRRKVVYSRIVGGHLEGKVFWDDGKHDNELGSVSLKTSNGGNILRLP